MNINPHFAKHKSMQVNENKTGGKAVQQRKIGIIGLGKAREQIPSTPKSASEDKLFNA